MKIVSVDTNFHTVNRPAFLNLIEDRFAVNPVVALLGPRQCGKTTLAREFLEQTKNSMYTQEWSKANYFNLENYLDLQRLSDPLLMLQSLHGLIVIDEIQRTAELFPTLRVLVDNRELKQHYLILGSASRKLLRQSTESLAGHKRIGFKVKYNAASSLTKSMRMTQDYLELDSLTVIYPGEVSYPLTETIQVVGLKTYVQQFNQ